MTRFSRNARSDSYPDGVKGDAGYSADGHVTQRGLIPYLRERVRRETRRAKSPTIADKFDLAVTPGR